MDYQTTLPEYDVPERVISYLSNYVPGNVIIDARIIDYNGQRVTIRFKDYKADVGIPPPDDERLPVTLESNYVT